MTPIQKALHCINNYYKEKFDAAVKEKMHKIDCSDDETRDEFAKFIMELGNEFDEETIFKTLLHIYVGTCVAMGMSKDVAREPFLSAFEHIKKRNEDE